MQYQNRITNKKIHVRMKFFTLVELLTVIAIILILAGLVIGGVKIAMDKALEAKARAQLEQIQSAIMMYKQEFGNYPMFPIVFTGTTATIFTSSTGAPILESFVKGADDGTYYHGLQPMSATNTGKNCFVDVTSLKFGLDSKSGTYRYCLDPYGRAYFYNYNTTFTGAHNKTTFDLWSWGKDSTGNYLTNTASTNWDNITNWGR